MHEQIVRCHQIDIVDDTNKITLAVALKGQQRSEPGAGPYRQDKTGVVVGAADDRRARRHGPQPLRARMFRDAIDHKMAFDIGGALWPAVAFHIGPTSIDRPWCLRDLAADESVIRRLATANRDIGLLGAGRTPDR